MKRSLSGFLAALAVIVSAAVAWGEGSPVLVTHTLTGYSKAEKAVTLEYTVQVQNREDAALGALALTLVPHPPLVNGKTTLTVDRLGAKAVTTLKVKVASPLLHSQDYFAKMPLLWAGRYTAADGRVVEFPVKSKHGGDK